MLSQKIEDAFNRQINAELSSAYLYLAMAANFDAQNLPGMAHWMRAQHAEEVKHALKFYEFINQRDGRVTLTQIDTPKAQWKTPLEAFEDAYRHEQHITGRVNDLVNLAATEKDHAAAAFLQWFVNEQVEEEVAARSIIEKLKLAGDSGVVYLMLDGQLGQRS